MKSSSMMVNRVSLLFADDKYWRKEQQKLPRDSFAHLSPEIGKTINKIHVPIDPSITDARRWLARKSFLDDCRIDSEDRETPLTNV